ncbi:MAG: TRL domain-containing protein [Candidatus Rokuibacteriota bacterium]
MKRALAIALVTGAALVGSGCLYSNIRTPRAYRSATPGDVRAGPTDPTVSGQGCYKTVLYLVSWGDASYAEAARRAVGADAARILYDVKADTRVTSILLGAYTEICTIVTGRLARP